MIDTITTAQLAEMLQIGTTKATQIMAGIKSISDTLGIAGICHRQDYDLWLKVRLGKNRKNADYKAFIAN